MSAVRCAQCGADWSVQLALLPNQKVGRRDTCPKCGADLHTCSNCEFYSESSRWECREEIGERVSDKEKSNFCDFFKVSHAIKKSGSLPSTAKIDLFSAAEALFKKK